MASIAALLTQVLFLSLLVLNPQGALGDETRKTQETWKEPATGMEFILVPSGCFSMGSPPEQEGRLPDEGPIHEVCVSPFWMSTREVTRAQFRFFVEATGYRTEAEKEGFSWAYDGNWIKKPGNDWQKAGFDQNDAHPVVNVSWEDAKAMAAWLSRKNKGQFRLPTEAEWEYACRAGTQTSRFWGDSSQEACKYANAADMTAAQKFPAWTAHNCEDGYIHTAPSGNYEPNAFGLYDMLGNVSEWCEDVYHKDAYAQGTGAKSAWYVLGASSRVIRGGSWFSPAPSARCATRDHLQSPSRRSHDLGFRLIREP